MAAMTLEQQRALALAAARRRKSEAGQTAASDRMIAVGGRQIPLAEYQAMSPEDRQTIRSQIADANPSVREEWSPPKMSGLLHDLTAGIDENVNTLLGAPIDFPVWVGNSLINATNSAVEMAGAGRPIPNIPTDLPGSSEGWERIQGQLGFTTPSQVHTDSTAGKLLRAAGGAVAGAAIPELLAVKAIQQTQQLGTAAAPLVRQVADVSRNLLGAGDDAGRMASNMAINAAAGAGAQAGVEVAPDGWEMPAALAGGLIAGTPVALATAAPEAARVAANVGGDYLAPLSQAGRERMAGQTIADAATDVGAVREALDNVPAPIVRGSQPTTFQATGDMGLGGLERGVATRNPADFNQRIADQNAARLDALGSIQPGGAPEQVAASVRTFVNAIDADTQAALDAVSSRWGQTVADVGARGDQGVAAAQQQARMAAEGLGQGRVPEVVGGDMRQALESARAQAKEQERALWKAVDPDNSIALPISSSRDRVETVYRELTPLSAKPEGVEAVIYADIRGAGTMPMPLRAVRDLDTRVKTAMREERDARGESTAYRRLVQLKSAIERDLDAAVAGKVAQDRQAVQAGTMRPEDTFEAWLKQDAERWFAERNGQALSGRGDAGVGRPSGGGQTPVSGVRGTAGQGQGGLGGATGNPPVPGQPLGANFDQAALDRLRAARGATLERVNTFDNRVLGPMRARPSSASDYVMPAGTVPQKVFFPGTASAEAIAKFRNAVGDEQAMGLLSDFIVDRLRKTAMRADGTLDPAKVASFQRSHADALRSFPALNARFGGAANLSSNIPVAEAARSQAVKDVTKAAEEAIASQALARKQQLDAAQKGAVGRLMGVEDPSDVTRVVGGIFSRQDAVNEMARIRRAIGSDKQAQEGLRKAIVDHVEGRFVSNTAAGTSEQNLIKSNEFQNFVKRNQSALSVAGFTADEIKVMQDIAADLRRSNQSTTAVRLPGGSNTAQDAFAAKVTDTPASLLTKIIGAGAASGGLSSVFLGPVLGIPVGLATSLVTAMRQAGLEQIDDIVKDAMLNPQRARLLLQKVKPRDASNIGQILAQQYRRAAVVSAAQGD